MSLLGRASAACGQGFKHTLTTHLGAFAFGVPARYIMDTLPLHTPVPQQASSTPPWVLPSTAASGTVMPCLFCDGAARGNPGAGGAGAILFSPGGLSVLAYQHRRLGDSVTNNAAEYEAVKMGLQLTKKAGVKAVHVFLDSQLIVKQLGGQYAVKAKTLKPLFKDVLELSKAFSSIRFQHVPRQDNASADLLANAALDKRDDVPDLYIAALSA